MTDPEGGTQLASVRVATSAVGSIRTSGCAIDLRTDSACLGPAAGDSLHRKVGCGIGLLPMRAPITQLIHRNCHAAQCTKDMIAGAQHTIGAGEIVQARKA